MNKKKTVMVSAIFFLTILIAALITTTQAALPLNETDHKSKVIKITSTEDLRKIGVNNVEFNDLIRLMNSHDMSIPVSGRNSSVRSNGLLSQGSNYQAWVGDYELELAGEVVDWPICTGVFGTCYMDLLDLTGDTTQWTSMATISDEWDFAAEVGIVYFHYNLWGWMPPLFYFTTWEQGYHANGNTELYYINDWWYSSPVSVAVGRGTNDDTNNWYAYADCSYGWQLLDSHDYGQEWIGFPTCAFECSIDINDPGKTASEWVGQNWLPPEEFGWIETTWEENTNSFTYVDLTFTNNDFLAET